MQIIEHNFIKNIVLPDPCDPCDPCSLFYSNTDFHGMSRNITEYLFNCIRAIRVIRTVHSSASV